MLEGDLWVGSSAGVPPSLNPNLLPCLQLPQSLPGLVQRLIALAERKSHLLCPVPPIIVEARPGDRRHSDFFHQVFREREIVCEPEAANVGHDVVGAARTKAAEANLL